MGIQGNVVDVKKRIIFYGEVELSGSRICRILNIGKAREGAVYILPGLVDSHVHIESSMLTPAQFAKLVVRRGTVGVVNDPHEIGNVLGLEGVKFMLNNAKTVPFKFYFGAPSCVPATNFETSGDELNISDIEKLLEKDEVVCLSEMMNFPGVIFQDKKVLDKISVAKRFGKPVDGHAPGLNGLDLRSYVAAGISTDHECFSMAEALEKISLGMFVLIREGSAAKNFEALYSLISTHPGKVMLCTDDSHPDEILRIGHIDKLIKRGLAKNLDVFNLLQAAVVNPVLHYNLNIGLLQEGDPADFILVDDLTNFEIRGTYINGNCVFDGKNVLFEASKSPLINRFVCEKLTLDDLKIHPESNRIRVIEAIEGELVTHETIAEALIENGNVVSNIDSDILKIVVVNRYKKEKPAVGFIKNLGLKQGALASCIAHDSHNIIAAGVSDEEILKAINRLIENKGGIVASEKGEFIDLPLPIGGILSDEDGTLVAQKYEQLNRFASQLGSSMKAPFMTLAFMSLLVIPKLKLGDRGLFDVEKFQFTSLFV